VHSWVVSLFSSHSSSFGFFFAGPQSAVSHRRKLLAAYKAARILHPSKLTQLTSSQAAALLIVQSLPIHFPWIDEKWLDELIEQLPKFYSAASRYSIEVPSDPNMKPHERRALEDKLVANWWRTHSSAFVGWARLFEAMLSIQPSSAFVERVFSSLKQMYGDDQTLALRDRKETSLMLKFNHE